MTSKDQPSLNHKHTALHQLELLVLYRPDLAEILAAANAPRYRYAQVLEHLFRRPLLPFSQATALPKEWRTRLDELGACTLSVVAERTAPDGTKKLLLQASDGQRIECVLMTYHDRVTACISSQVGCPVGCTFCATGALGFRRNLTVAEIVDQVRITAREAARAQRRLSNLVYMGMGEPLLNTRAVLASIRVITDPDTLGLGHRNISVSTIGIPRGIVRLAIAQPQVNLALSLHAADDHTRALLIPDKFRHPLAEILEAAWRHFNLTHRKLLVEYVLFRGLNDSLADARRLAQLLRGHIVAVNLIPWNPVSVPTARPQCPAGHYIRKNPILAAPAPTAVVAFREALLRAGLEAVVRESKGASIEAACGQLAGKSRSYQA